MYPVPEPAPDLQGGRTGSHAAINNSLAPKPTPKNLAITLP